MNNPPIAELRAGDALTGVYLVNRREMKTTKTGKPYLWLVLRDKTGSLPGNYWDVPAKLAETIVEGRCVRLRARVETYNGKLQLKVENAIPTEEAAAADFLPESECDRNALLTELRGRCEKAVDPDVRRLLLAFLDDRDFLAAFSQAPAATTHHHAWLGGLLEHTAGVVRLADKIADAYSFLNRDLLLAGAVLHDIGKTREFTYATSIGMSDEGLLVGHITIGVLMVREKIAGLPGFPTPVADLILHMILSHHGELEFGAVRKPAIPEALALYRADDLDAKLTGARCALEAAEDNAPWTEYVKMFDGRLFRGQRPA